jgi:hypothetical protein
METLTILLKRKSLRQRVLFHVVVKEAIYLRIENILGDGQDCYEKSWSLGYWLLSLPAA